VQPDDVESLAESIMRLINDPSLAKRMGRAGRRRVEDRFSLRQTINALEYVILECSRRLSPS